MLQIRRLDNIRNRHTNNNNQTGVPNIYAAARPAGSARDGATSRMGHAVGPHEPSHLAIGLSAFGEHHGGEEEVVHHAVPLRERDLDAGLPGASVEAAGVPT